jgi:peptide/nickel transport system substrate-binding protein
MAFSPNSKPKKEGIMKKSILILFLVLALAIPSAVLAAGAADEKTFVYATYGDVKVWDPSVAFSLEVYLFRQVYETLTYYNTPGAMPQVLPGLATSWEVSPDGLTWTFKLRKGVKFHDGEPFNAAAVKYSIDRTKKLGKGAAFIWGAVAEIKVVDDYTVQFVCKNPAPLDIIASAQYGAYIFSPKAGEKGTDWFMQGNEAGTGPYKVDHYEKSQEVILSKFDEYWGGWDGKHFERAILKVVSEASTHIQMLKSGEADYSNSIAADALPAMRKTPGVTVLTPNVWRNAQWLINTQKAPTDNVKIRQAICYAFDYEGFVNGIADGNATIPSGVIPPTLWGHNPDLRKYSLDLEKAKKLVAESGVPKDKLKLRIAYISTTQEYSQSAQMLQANLAQIGITVELTPGPWSTIWDQAKNLDTAPNIQSMTWWPTWPSPSDWLIGLFKTEEKALFNLSHYANPQYDALVDKGVKLEGVDRAAATKAYQDAQELLVDDAAAVFFADWKGRVVMRESVKGYVPNPAYDVGRWYTFHRE